MIALIGLIVGIVLGVVFSPEVPTWMDAYLPGHSFVLADNVDARRWYGDAVLAPNDPDQDDPGYYPVTGHSSDGYEAALPGVEVTAVVLEFGTYPLDRGSEALGQEHWLNSNNGTCGGRKINKPDANAFRLMKSTRWMGLLMRRLLVLAGSTTTQTA